MRMDGAPPLTALVLPPFSERMAALKEVGSPLLTDSAPPMLELDRLSTNLLFFVHEDDVQLVKMDGCAEFYEPKAEGNGRLLATITAHPSRDDDIHGALRLLTEAEMEMCVLQESQLILHHTSFHTSHEFEMTFNPSNMAWFSANDLFDALGHFETAKAQATGHTNMRHAFFEGLIAHGSQPGHYKICWGS